MIRKLGTHILYRLSGYLALARMAKGAALFTRNFLSLALHLAQMEHHLRRRLQQTEKGLTVTLTNYRIPCCRESENMIQLRLTFLLPLIHSSAPGLLPFVWTRLPLTPFRNKTSLHTRLLQVML